MKFGIDENKTKQQDWETSWSCLQPNINQLKTYLSL